LGSVESPYFNAFAVDSGGVKALMMKVRENFFDGMKEFFRSDFSRFVMIDTGFRLSYSMLSVVIPPSLNGSPSELIRVSFFVFEDLLANAEIALLKAVSFGEFECA